MHYLVNAIIEQLQRELDTAAEASQQAHASATHSENVADNKYDTLAVEAAYLAHGQSLRIIELQQSIARYQHFKRPNIRPISSIEMGALVCIEDEQGMQRSVFIGPAAGGLRIETGEGIIQVISPSTPLGNALMDKQLDDEVTFQLNQQYQRWRIVGIE
ncbi:MAG: transcription elongation GreA/GreB family factor [Pseudohongiellaceae bacterium]|jgi:transcription elongation GreA/GreB family factor